MLDLIKGAIVLGIAAFIVGAALMSSVAVGCLAARWLGVSICN